VSALANARRWLVTHRTEALAGGGAGVVGLALYHRRRGSVASASSPAAMPTAGGTGALDPSSAAASPVFSDVDAALLDSDLTGISGALDSIRATLGKLSPARSKTDVAAANRAARARKKAKQAKVAAANRAARARKKHHHRPTPKPPAPTSTSSTSVPTSRAAQQRRATTAAYARMTGLPAAMRTDPLPRRSTSNPRPATDTRPTMPVVGQVSGARRLAPPSPRPAAPVRATVPAGGPTRMLR
jgi:hypothetical protein